MDDLNVYFVVFSKHEGRQWTGHAGYIFAKKEEDIKTLLSKRHGEVNVRSVEQVSIEEGTVLYGERWRSR